VDLTGFFQDSRSKQRQPLGGADLGRRIEWKSWNSPDVEELMILPEGLFRVGSTLLGQPPWLRVAGTTGITTIFR